MKSKRRKWMWIGAVIVVAFVLLAALFAPHPPDPLLAEVEQWAAQNGFDLESEDVARGRDVPARSRVVAAFRKDGPSNEEWKVLSEELRKIGRKRTDWNLREEGYREIIAPEILQEFSLYATQDWGDTTVMLRLESTGDIPSIATLVVYHRIKPLWERIRGPRNGQAP